MRSPPLSLSLKEGRDLNTVRHTLQREPLHFYMTLCFYSGGQINHVSQCRDIPSKAFWVPETQNMLIAIILISDHEVPQYYGRLSPLSQTMRGVVRVIYANMV